MVATHPQRLQDAIGTAIGDVRKTLSNNTIIMIRSLGAADEEFPITDAVCRGSIGDLHALVIVTHSFSSCLPSSYKAPKTSHGSSQKPNPTIEGVA